MAPRIGDLSRSLHRSGLPNRITHAEVVVEEGLPVFQNLDWAELTYAPEILVPEDAWADWDPVEMRFITVGEKHAAAVEAAEAAAAEAEEGEEVEIPGPVTALRKSVAYYQEDLFDVVKWHDGSPFSVGDILMGIILTFDRGKADSAIYDAAAAPTLRSFLGSFKGVKIVSTDPLVIETYSDVYYQDAELNVNTWWLLRPGSWRLAQPLPWHLAEADHSGLLTGKIC